MSEIRTQRQIRVAAFISVVSPLISDPKNTDAQVAFYDYIAREKPSQKPLGRVAELQKVIGDNSFRQRLGEFITTFTGKLGINEKRLDEAKQIATSTDLPEPTRIAILEREYPDLVEVAKRKANIETQVQAPDRAAIPERTEPIVATPPILQEAPKPVYKPKTVKEQREVTLHLADDETLVPDSDLEVLASIMLNGPLNDGKKGFFRGDTLASKVITLIVERTNKGGIDTKELMDMLGSDKRFSILGAISDTRRKLEIFNQTNISSVEYKIHSTEANRGVSARFFFTEVKKKKVDSPTSPEAPINRPPELDKPAKLRNALDSLATEEGLDNALIEAKSLFKSETDPATKKALKGFINESEALLREGEELADSKPVKDINKGKVRGRGMERIYKPDEIISYTQVPILEGEIPWQFQEFSLLGIHLKNGVRICLDFVDHSKAIVSMIEVLKTSRFSRFSQLKSLINKFAELENPTLIIKGDKKLENYNIYIHISGGSDGLRIFYTPIIRRYKSNNVEYVDRIMVIHAIADYNNEGTAYTLLKSAITRAKSKHERKMKGKK